MSERRSLRKYRLEHKREDASISSLFLFRFEKKNKLMYSSSYIRLSKGIALEAKTPWSESSCKWAQQGRGSRPPRLIFSVALFLFRLSCSVVCGALLSCVHVVVCIRYNFGSTYKGKIKASRLYLESPAVNLELSSWIRSRPIGSTRIFTVCRETLVCCSVAKQIKIKKEKLQKTVKF